MFSSSSRMMLADMLTHWLVHIFASISYNDHRMYLDMPILLAEQLDKLEAVLEPLSLD
jgi:hypothetical protein